MRDLESENRELRAQLAIENVARVRAEAELAKARAWRKQAEKGMGSDKWLPEEMAKLEERAEKAEKERDDLKAQAEAAQRRVEEFVRRFKAYNDGGRTQAQWERLCDLVFALSRATEQGKENT